VQARVRTETRGTLADLVKTSRPFSWINTAYVFAAGAHLGAGWSAGVLLGTFYFSFPFNLLLYGINDLFDYESDARNPRKNSIEGAVLAPKRLRALLTAIAITNLPLLALLFSTGSRASAAALAALLFTAVAYSAPPLRLKEKPVLDSFTSATHFVLPLIVGLLYGRAGFLPWPEIAAFTLWAMASQAFGAIQDIEPDRAAGIASIATAFGARRTAVFALTLYLAAAGIVLSIHRTPGYLLVGAVLLLYPANVLLALREREGARRGWRRFLWLNLLTGAAVTRAFYIGR